jgi:hypothetical protein
MAELDFIARAARDKKPSAPRGIVTLAAIVFQKQPRGYAMILATQ